MSSVTSSTARSSQSQRPEPQGDRTRQILEDVAAMKDALAAAKQRQQMPGVAQRGAEAKMADAQLQARLRDADGRVRMDREQQDGVSGQASLALANGPAAPQGVIAVPQAPPPQTDPTAFAQLIGQLWAREQAKGAREVQVRFGEAAWPAVGARLVRAADGALDIALLVGKPHSGVDAALPRLRERFAERGLAVGALAVNLA